MSTRPYSPTEERIIRERFAVGLERAAPHLEALERAMRVWLVDEEDLDAHLVMTDLLDPVVDRFAEDRELRGVISPAALEVAIHEHVRRHRICDPAGEGLCTPALDVVIARGQRTAVEAAAESGKDARP